MNEQLKQILSHSSHIRRRIRNECYVTNATLCNWQKPGWPIPPLALEKINEIFNQELVRGVFTDINEQRTAIMS